MRRRLSTGEQVFATLGQVSGFNPPISWSELERRLSDRRPAGGRPGDPLVRGDGGDAPSWSHKRPPYQPPPTQGNGTTTRGSVPYAELHAHSNFSFLDG